MTREEYDSKLAYLLLEINKCEQHLADSPDEDCEVELGDTNKVYKNSSDLNR